MKKILSFLIILNIPVFTITAQDYLLRLKLEKGKSYAHEYNSEVNIRQEFYGKTIRYVRKINSLMGYTVKSRTDSLYILEVMFHDLKYSVDSPLMSYEFNSENEGGEGLYADVMMEFIEVPMIVQMNDKGRVLSVEGFEEVWNEILDNRTLSEADKMNLRQQAEQAFGKESLKEKIELATAVFPERKVSPGDEWPVSLTTKGEFGAKVKNTFLLKDVKEGVVLLEGKSDFTDPDPEQKNNKITDYNMQGEFNSGYKLDLETGWLIRADVVQNMKGEITLRRSPQNQDDMIVPMEVHAVIEVTGSAH